MNFKNVKNIVFDLGGVIINIDFKYTYEAFANLCNTDASLVKRKFEELNIFPRFEIGDLSESEFRALIKKEIKGDYSDDRIDEAWNALLRDIPQTRIDLIQNLKGKYRLFLLSNTNSVHIREVNNILHRATGITSLDVLFEKIYYSYDIALAKPGREIYDYVIRDKGLDVKETIFLDDSPDNVKGALTAGWQAVHVTQTETILEILKDA